MITPAIAARVWISDQTLYLELPSPVPNARATVVQLTCDPEGFEKAVEILRHRGPKATIGTIGAPTQRMVEKDILLWLKENKPKPKEPAPEVREAVRGVLKRTGLL